jgi:hypothetical protein
MIDMDTILAALDDQVRTNILIFDACRNNPMADARPRRSRGCDQEQAGAVVELVVAG